MCFLLLFLGLGLVGLFFVWWGVCCLFVLGVVVVVVWVVVVPVVVRDGWGRAGEVGCEVGFFVVGC
ncbi:hypothetical protein, partial [Pseudomonas syringae group genomosp. 7]|uniref:hypothetical protein n=1 Tax=Pseudomonas syringae group genomosp. 7 TaxID=251699 RepID=UPI00376F5BB6